ncbi:MAG: hypothetical protein NT062_39300 [Proteobacteria bacterium]|nr:hypothetical protein [Pseudomonadota bacterium]
MTIGTIAGVGVLGVVAGAAHADARIDWATGFVIADGVGVADRHAPSPAVARGTSRRGAEEAAMKQIAALVPTLPVATGGTVGDRAKLAAGVTLAAEPETDGAWRVTVGVPIEAIRQAIDGPRAWTPSGGGAAGGDVGPAIVVVRVPRSITVTPAVGWRIAGQAVATLFVGKLPAWVDKATPVVRVTRATRGELAIDKPAGNASTLFVVAPE